MFMNEACNKFTFRPRATQTALAASPRASFKVFYSTHPNAADLNPWGRLAKLFIEKFTQGTSCLPHKTLSPPPPAKQSPSVEKKLYSSLISTGWKNFQEHGQDNPNFNFFPLCGY
jgi:hypothetical protein